MNYHSHRVAGFCLGLTGGMLLTQCKTDVVSISLTTFSAINGTVSALLPDIDHRNSYIGKKHKITSYIASKTLGHRGAMHSPFILLVLSVIILCIMYFIPSNIWNINIFNMFNIKEFSKIFFVSFVAGYLSHLLMDSLTVSGIPWCYPFSKRCYAIGKLKTNKNELIAQLLFIIPTIFFVCFKYNILILSI